MPGLDINPAYTRLKELDEDQRETLIEALRAFCDENKELTAVGVIPNANNKELPVEKRVKGFNIKPHKWSDMGYAVLDSVKRSKYAAQEMAEQLLQLKEAGYKIYNPETKQELIIGDFGGYKAVNSEAPEKPAQVSDLNFIQKWIRDWLPTFIYPRSWDRKAEAYANWVEADKQYRRDHEIWEAGKIGVACREEFEALAPESNIERYAIKPSKGAGENEISEGLTDRIEERIENNSYKMLEDDRFYVRGTKAPELMTYLLSDLAYQKATNTNPDKENEYKRALESVVEMLKSDNPSDLAAEAEDYPENYGLALKSLDNFVKNNKRGFYTPLTKDGKGVSAMDHLMHGIREFCGKFDFCGGLDSESMFYAKIIANMYKQADKITQMYRGNYEEWYRELPKNIQKEYNEGLSKARGILKFTEMIMDGREARKMIYSSDPEERAQAAEKMLIGHLAEQYYKHISPEERNAELNYIGDNATKDLFYDKYRNHVRSSDIYKRIAGGDHEVHQQSAIERAELVSSFIEKRNEANISAGRFVKSEAPQPVRRSAQSQPKVNAGPVK